MDPFPIFFEQSHALRNVLLVTKEEKSVTDSRREEKTRSFICLASGRS
jgi:hypothetical protein